jgi:hypothetical protein
MASRGVGADRPAVAVAEREQQRRLDGRRDRVEPDEPGHHQLDRVVAVPADRGAQNAVLSLEHLGESGPEKPPPHLIDRRHRHGHSLPRRLGTRPESIVPGPQ